MSKPSLQQKRQSNLDVIRQSLPSSDPRDYTIERRDYTRGNSDERFYKTRWWATLMRIYDCRCALCGADQDGIELDHFWVPKACGGNLMLRRPSLEGFINNGVPLCTTCNRKKQEFVVQLDDVQLKRIADANRFMTAAINNAQIVDGSAGLTGYELGDERRALGVPGMLGEMARLYKSRPEPKMLEMLKEDIERYLLVTP